jgi:hypothetical protein
MINAVKTKLLQHGFSISSWARKNNFYKHNAHKYILRYAKKPQLPHSPEVYKILNQLYLDTGVNLMEPENGAERADKKMEEAL